MKNKSARIFGGTVSTATDRRGTEQFSNLNSKSKKNSIESLHEFTRSHNKELVLSDNQKKYASGASYKKGHSYSQGDIFNIILDYDANKLAQDGRIFMLLDGDGIKSLQSR
jgi:hypothetical protein